MRMITRIALVVGLAAALGACGGGDDDGTVVDSGPTADGNNLGYAGCTTFTDLTAATAALGSTRMERVL